MVGKFAFNAHPVHSVALAGMVVCEMKFDGPIKPPVKLRRSFYPVSILDQVTGGGRSAFPDAGSKAFSSRLTLSRMDTTTACSVVSKGKTARLRLGVGAEKKSYQGTVEKVREIIKIKQVLV